MDRKDPPTPLTIGLMWHSVRSDNLGVGALTHGDIALVDEAAKAIGSKVQFLIIGAEDSGENRPDFAAISTSVVKARTLIHPGGVFKALRGCDLVLDITGGDSFTDIYGPKRLFYMTITKLLARLARKPLILAPQTLGPFTKRWSKAIAAFTRTHATSVFTRDALSIQHLKEIAPNVKATQSTDVAFVMPYTRREFPADDRVRVGINVSGLLFNGGYTGRNELGLKDSYPALIEALCRAFTAMPQVDLHFIGHVNSERAPIEDDYRVCATLAARHSGSVLAPRFTSPIEAKGYIAGLDFFVGARMHATIAAFSAGVPVIPMAYSRKFAGVFGALGYNECVDLKIYSNELALSKILEGFRNRLDLKVAVEAGRAKADELLEHYRAALRDALHAATAKRQGVA